MILGFLDLVAKAVGFKTKTVYMSAEYGLPPGAIYAEELAQFSDLELIQRDRASILAECRRMRAAGTLRRLPSGERVG